MRPTRSFSGLEPLGMWKLSAGVLVCLFFWGVKESRHYNLYVDNFGVVEPGVLYRSGQLRGYQLEKLIRKLDLRTVINTREPEARVEAERLVCAKLGVRMVRLPMPGDGCGTYAQYEEALALLRDTNNLPALVHCARGTHRTGAVVAAYRVHVQGREIGQTFAEMQRYKFNPKDHPLVDHLAPYLEGRAGSPGSLPHKSP
jgi:tyrosine-protein phosphatase SIW14